MYVLQTVWPAWAIVLPVMVAVYGLTYYAVRKNTPYTTRTVEVRRWKQHIRNESMRMAVWPLYWLFVAGMTWSVVLLANATR